MFLKGFDFVWVMNNEIKKLNEEKIAEAFSKDIKLHISLKDESWRNGFVKEVSDSFFIFDDVVNGKEAIFFLELKEVSPYLEGGG